MEMVQYNYTIAMAEYLENSNSKNVDVIRAEFIDYIANSYENAVLASTLINLGDSQCLQAYIESHGNKHIKAKVSNLRRDVSVVSILGYINSDEFIKSLEIIHGIQNNLTDQKIDTHAIMMKAKNYDDPRLIESCTKRMDIGVDGITDFLITNDFIEDAGPCIQAWAINFMNTYITPESVSVQKINDHVEVLLKKNGVRTIAYYLKSGFNIIEAINCPFTQKQNSNEWFVRLARRMSSSHDFVKMYAKLPDVETIFAMDKKELTHLMAGKSKKELKRERIKKAAEKRNEAALNRVPSGS